MKHVVAAGMLVVLIAVAVSAADPIARSPNLPKSAPWNLEALSAVPEVEWVDSKSSVRSLFYAGEPYGGKPTRVFAYYASPATLMPDTPKAGFPAVVLVHGGGGTAFREWAELWAKRGYAAIAMDLAGHRPHEGVNAHAPANRTRLPDGAPNQGDDEKFGSIDKPAGEQWPYHAVADVIRAHSLIRSLPEVNRDQTAVTGISWGGYLTCIVAGVDSRFKAAVPVYGCGFLHENSAWLGRLGKLTPEQKARWVELWDPSRYLPAVSMPILFVNGTNDFAYPLDSYEKSFAAVPGEKYLSITVKMPHGHPPGWAPPVIAQFVDWKLRGGDPIVILAKPEVTGNTAVVAIAGKARPAQGALHYTVGKEAINMREWISVEARLDGDRLQAPTPPADATLWFFTATSPAGSTVSTQVIAVK